MKIATLYRKDGKVILETDNDVIAQVATDTPQDVVVMAAHYFTGERQVGRPAALAAPYGPNVPPHDVAEIDEVRERLEKSVAGPLTTYTAVCAREDLRALLAAHARLVEENLQFARVNWLVLNVAGGEAGVFIPNRAMEGANWRTAEISRDEGLGGVTLRATCKKAVQP